MSSAFQILWAGSLSRNWRGVEKEHKSIVKWFNSAVHYLYSVMFWRSLKSIVKSNYRHIHESIIHGASGFTGSQEPTTSATDNAQTTATCRFQGCIAFRDKFYPGSPFLKKRKTINAKYSTFQMVF